MDGSNPGERSPCAVVFGTSATYPSLNVLLTLSFFQGPQLNLGQLLFLRNVWRGECGREKGKIDRKKEKTENYSKEKLLRRGGGEMEFNKSRFLGIAGKRTATM